ncbi:MAG: ATP-grasp domain-containing protein, partial [Pseudomonadota bacterium]
QIDYPVVVRPSYVLGGRAMEIVYDETALRRYMAEAVSVVGDNPVLIDSYLRDATEVDVDAICDGQDVFIAGIMEHIEEAGIHSGDSACALPPQNLSQEVVDGLADQARKLALALEVVGLINVQFAVKDGQIYVIEANPRASRTVPFVAKATGIPVAKIAARVMAGEKLASFNLTEATPPHVSVKEAVFPFAKFPGVDVILGPEMKSTGEVMGIDESFARAFCKAQLGAGAKLPLEGCVFVSVKDVDKPAIVAPARRLIDLGYSLVATHGTASYLRDQGIEVGQVNKVLEGRPHVVDAMIDGRIQMVINTTEGAQAIRDSFDLRRTALTNSIPSFTTVRGAVAAVEALASLAQGQLEVAPLQSYSKWLSRH